MSDDENPSANHAAERYVLGSVLHKAAALAEAKACTGLFDVRAHQDVLDAMISLADQHKPIEVILLADEMRSRGTLGELTRLGGVAYFPRLAEEATTPENVGFYVDLVRRHAGYRKWLDLKARPAVPNDSDLDRDLAEIKSLRQETAGADDFAKPLKDDEDWTSAADEPDDDEYLLAHTTKGGLILRGTTGLIASGGGVGKTWLMMTLAVMVAAGRGQWGPFKLRSFGGRVLLLLREGSHKSLRKRLRNLMKHFGLKPEEQASVASRLALPRLDRERSVRLQEPLRRDRGNDDETPFARRLLGNLRRQQWDLIVFDSLAKFAGPDAETDNAAGDRLHDIFAQFTSLPGNPTVLVTHHMTKEALKPDAAAGAFMARGSSSLTNGFRFQANLLKKNGTVEMTVPKQNDGVELEGGDAIIFSRSAEGVLVHEARNEGPLPGIGRKSQ